MESLINESTADVIQTKLRPYSCFDAGWNYGKVAEALFVDDQTVRNYETTYQNKGIEGLLKTII